MYRMQISTTKQAARGFGLRFGKSCYFPAFYEGARFLFKFPHFFASKTFFLQRFSSICCLTFS